LLDKVRYVVGGMSECFNRIMSPVPSRFLSNWGAASFVFDAHVLRHIIAISSSPTCRSAGNFKVSPLDKWLEICYNVNDFSKRLQ
jgi:hypothetical protein